jgi:hypothetical protein
MKWTVLLLADLRQVELKSELGNASLAKRKRLWGYIVKLKNGEADVYYPQGDKGVMNMLLA